MSYALRAVSVFALMLCLTAPAFAARTTPPVIQPMAMVGEIPFVIDGQPVMTLDKQGLTVGGGLAAGPDGKGIFVDPATGNVGVGTRTPTASLEVAGDMRLGSAAHGFEVRTGGDCSVSGEGAMGYDRVAHKPVFCGERMVWSEIGGQETHGVAAVKTVMLDGLTCTAAVDRMNQAAGVRGGYKMPGSPQTLVSNNGAWMLIRLTNDCAPMVRIGRDIGLIALDAEGRTVQGFFRD